MTLKDIMQLESVLVLGNTIKEDRYAYKIKNYMQAAGYKSFAVPYEFEAIDDVKEDIDILDICINSDRACNLLEASNKKFKIAVIQPGAESDKLFNLLNAKGIPYIEGCLLVGLRIYKGFEVK